MIGPFRGEHRFLSNFWPAEIFYGGMVFPTVEHAYQAAKTRNLKHRRQIKDAATPGEAKRLGKLVSVRPGWENCKLKVMWVLVGQKFERHVDLAILLLETGDEEIVEVNGWGDRFWGVCNGEGKNYLGEILMSLRGGLRKEKK